MASWIDALARTRKTIASALGRVFRRTSAVDPATLEELESVLMQADMPARLVMETMADVEKRKRQPDVTIRDILRTHLIDALGTSPAFDWNRGGNPFVVLLVGINGSGKTTTSAKLAHLAKKSGRKPLLGAGDTFRAAGSDQLRIWADRVGCPVVAGASGGDAAAVAFDAVTAGKARGCDVVLFDTAGRMHTKEPLMQELQKVQRAMGKSHPGAPHETWIVLDASMGQNAVNQARTFHSAVPLTGAVVSKLDGSSKAGFIFALRRELDIPIVYVGLGEGMDDLAPFEPVSFVDALLGLDAEGTEVSHAEART